MIARFLVGPQDPIRLDTFRAAFGLVLIAYMLHWWVDDAQEWLTVSGFHLSAAAAGPGWLSPPPLPVAALVPFGAAFFLVLLAFALGFRMPYAAVLALGFVTYVSHVDPLASFTPNNLFMVGLALFCFVPRASYWTVDPVSPREVSVWPVRVLQISLILIYLTAGTCKVFYGDWLTDSHVLWSQVHGPFRTDIAAFLLRHLPREAWTVLQSLSLGFELLAPVLLAVRRLRPLAFLWGGGMHLGIALTMDEIGYLSLQMVCFYILFVDDATLHGWRRRLAVLGRSGLGRGGTSAPAEGSPNPTGSTEV